MVKKHVLIIEDNKEIGEIYSLTLGMEDYDPEHILDGKQALERLSQITPDLIILDMNLPQISGHYIYKKIRADPRLKEVKVVISTANLLIARALQEELGPFDRLLVKPVSPKMLKEVVDKF